MSACRQEQQPLFLPPRVTRHIFLLWSGQWTQRASILALKSWSVCISCTAVILSTRLCRLVWCRWRYLRASKGHLLRSVSFFLLTIVFFCPSPDPTHHTISAHQCETIQGRKLSHGTLVTLYFTFLSCNLQAFVVLPCVCVEYYYIYYCKESRSGHQHLF